MVPWSTLKAFSFTLAADTGSEILITPQTITKIDNRASSFILSSMLTPPIININLNIKIYKFLFRNLK
jgi:hypothetical protein